MDLFSEEHVLFHRKVKEDVQLLVDKHDSRFLSFLGILVRDLLVVHDDCAGISRVDSGQDLHQSGFSCAVFSHQCMDLSIRKDKTRIAEHRIVSEGFVDPPHFDMHDIPPVRKYSLPEG